MLGGFISKAMRSMIDDWTKKTSVIKASDTLKRMSSAQISQDPWLMAHLGYGFMQVASGIPADAAVAVERAVKIKAEDPSIRIPAQREATQRVLKAMKDMADRLKAKTNNFDEDTISNMGGR